jgi:hypothetical protein
MSGLDRWLPRLLTGLGGIHLLFGVVESPGVIRDMLADGLVGTADTAERAYVVWFLVAGMAMLTIGALAGYAVRTTGRLPASLGWWLIGTGLLITVTQPTSGGWLLMLLGFLAVVAARRSARPPAAVSR